MSNSCKRCGSYAINHGHHGRDGSDPDLCDVCYWRKRAEKLDPTVVFKRHGFHRSASTKVQEWYCLTEKAFLALCDDPERFACNITCHGQTAEKGKWYAVVLP